MSVVHTVTASASSAIDPTSMSVQRRRRLRRRARDESGAVFTFTSFSRNVGWSSLGFCLTNSNGAGRPCRGAMLISRCALCGRPDRCRRSASGSEVQGATCVRRVLGPSGDRLGQESSGGGSSCCRLPPTALPGLGLPFARSVPSRRRYPTTLWILPILLKQGWLRHVPAHRSNPQTSPFISRGTR